VPPILIQGETGTGKRPSGASYAPNQSSCERFFRGSQLRCNPETFLEAELFGYERRAFTDARQSKPGLFHVAHGGTLFLDEVGLLPRGLQGKLLSVLDQGSLAAGSNQERSSQRRTNHYRPL